MIRDAIIIPFHLISPRFTSFLEVVDGTTETGSIPCSRDRGTPGFERGSCGVKRWWLWGYHSKLWTFQGVTNRGFGKLSTNILYHQFHIFQKRLLKTSDYLFEDIAFVSSWRFCSKDQQFFSDGFFEGMELLGDERSLGGGFIWHCFPPLLDATHLAKRSE